MHGPIEIETGDGTKLFLESFKVTSWAIARSVYRPLRLSDEPAEVIPEPRVTVTLESTAVRIVLPKEKPVERKPRNRADRKVRVITAKTEE